MCNRKQNKTASYPNSLQRASSLLPTSAISDCHRRTDTNVSKDQGVHRSFSATWMTSASNHRRFSLNPNVSLKSHMPMHWWLSFSAAATESYWLCCPRKAQDATGQNSILIYKVFPTDQILAKLLAKHSPIAVTTGSVLSWGKHRLRGKHCLYTFSQLQAWNNPRAEIIAPNSLEGHSREDSHWNHQTKVLSCSTKRRFHNRKATLWNTVLSISYKWSEGQHVRLYVHFKNEKLAIKQKKKIKEEE